MILQKGSADSQGVSMKKRKAFLGHDVDASWCGNWVALLASLYLTIRDDRVHVTTKNPSYRSGSGSRFLGSRMIYSLVFV